MNKLLVLPFLFIFISTYAQSDLSEKLKNSSVDSLLNKSQLIITKDLTSSLLTSLLKSKISGTVYNMPLYKPQEGIDFIMPEYCPDSSIVYNMPIIIIPNPINDKKPNDLFPVPKLR
jgi:hypothetical protein